LRVDAQRRREALLCAAASVFLAQGIDAPLESVARAAGVGIATLYRRFPTRGALIEAVFEAKMARYADLAEVAAEKAIDEPWAAFRDHLSGLVDIQVTDPAFGAALLRPMQGSPLFAREHDRAFAATVRLVDRARDAGAVRADIDHTDLYLMLAAVSAAVAEPGPLVAARAGHRLAALLLDSFRKAMS
jgi:AcrR family transcriptional regulator